MYNPLDVALVYVSLFPARSDVYSSWVKEIGGWRPVREPLTPAVALAGLTGKGPAISGYMITPDGLTHSLAIDFDTDNGLEQAFGVSEMMKNAGLPAYVETSRRGAHLWAILDRRVTARVARNALRAFLASSLADPGNVQIEIRPGSDAIAEGGLGHALRLPLMPHPKTGVLPTLHDPDGYPMGPTIASVLLNVDLGSAEIIEKWAGRWREPTVVSPMYRNPRPPRDDDDASASELLQNLWGAIDAAPGKVISCPASEYHSHGDRNKGCRVFPDDKRVMCHRVGCILNNDGRGRGTYEIRKLAPHAT